jgi:hypothetical protein
VIRAKDPSLVGDRLLSIGGKDVADIEAALRPLVPADNESGELDGLQGLFSYAAFLHGAGIVGDRAKPGYALERPNGEAVTVDPSAVDVSAWETSSASSVTSSATPRQPSRVVRNPCGRSRTRNGRRS